MKPRRRVDPQERKSASTGQIIKDERVERVERHARVRDRLKMQTETRVQELMIEVRAYCKAQERV